MSDATGSHKAQVEASAVAQLSEDVFSCDFEVTTTTSILLGDGERPYDYLKHAEDRLQHAKSDLDLSDCIINLKRALDHRIKRLYVAHALKRASGLPRNAHDALKFLGLMRPVMSKELHDLRNRIEHGFVDAPSSEQCERWAEFVWYFLRSTDSSLKWRPSDIRFARSDEYWIELSRGRDDGWDISIRGWIHGDEINSLGSDTLGVKVDQLLVAASAIQLVPSLIRGSFERPSADDLYLSGSIVDISKSAKLMNLFVENRDLSELFEFKLK